MASDSRPALGNHVELRPHARPIRRVKPDRMVISFVDRAIKTMPEKLPPTTRRSTGNAASRGQGLEPRPSRSRDLAVRVRATFQADESD